MIPLALSAFTHLWNVVGFPAIHPDEGVYMRRVMLVIKGLGPHDPAAHFDHSLDTTSSYDHPYFGQIFLAWVLGAIGYPNSLHPSTDVHSIEMLFLVPRMLMGILAVVDTFLVYKICEYRYNNRTVAFIASILFAVMPLSWLNRWILLDSILLPFLLSSILFAIYCKRNSNEVSRENNYILTLFSGIFLGLAIYTKIPIFTMVPMIGFLIYMNNNRNLKVLGLWFIPVIIIPMLWPIYSILAGQYNDWEHGVLWQATQRHSQTKQMPNIKLNEFFTADPILLILGGLGFVFSSIKRDFMLLLWLVPYILFLSLIGWIILFHWIPVIPAFCIATAKLIVAISNVITKKKTLSKYLVFIITSGIAIFGLTSTTILIASNLSSSEFEAAAFVGKYVGDTGNTNSYNKNDDVTIISSPIYSWLFASVFNNEHVFSHIRDASVPVQTKKVVMIEDAVYDDIIFNKNKEDPRQMNLIGLVHNNTKTVLRLDKDNNYYKDVMDRYPYTSLIKYGWAAEIRIRANY
jgi:Dolichyl-phosphate-mannose-protein mannosyltransferase